VGGNLVTASPSADTAPALLAAAAAVRIDGAEGGPRELPLTEFFVDYRKTALEPGEIVTHVLVPLAGRPVPGRFEKVGLRNADAISVVCAACEVELDGSTCRAARIGLGAVAPVPVRALAVEAALHGRKLTADVVAEAARLVHEHIAPIDDVRASGRYRGWVAEAVVARMLTEIAEEAKG
jgi:xanthine dehydrogenase small subunit